MSGRVSEKFLNHLYTTMAGGNALRPLGNCSLIDKSTGDAYVSAGFLYASTEGRRLKLVFKGNGVRTGSFNYFRVYNELGELYIEGDISGSSEEGRTYYVYIYLSVEAVVGVNADSDVTYIYDNLIYDLENFFNTQNYDYVRLWDKVRINYSEGFSKTTTLTPEVVNDVFRVTFNELSYTNHVESVEVWVKALPPPYSPAIYISFTPPIRVPEYVFTYRMTLHFGVTINECETAETWRPITNETIEVTTGKKGNAVKITGTTEEFGAYTDIDLSPPYKIQAFIKSNASIVCLSALDEQNNKYETCMYGNDAIFKLTPPLQIDSRVVTIMVKGKTTTPPAWLIIDSIIKS